MNPTTTIAELKKRLYIGLNALAHSEADTAINQLRKLYHPNVHWRGSHPLNELHGIDAVNECAWQPLLKSMPDLERRDLILLAGSFEGRHYVATLGHYCGTFRNDWLGIPANGQPQYLRYGEVHQVVDGMIMQSSCLWDVLDVIRQAGFWPLPPSLGREGMWPGPITGDGIALVERNEAESRQSIASTLAMHKSLADYDDSQQAGREGLLNMPQKEHWHPKMMWYGPSGIGTTRGLQGFVDYHQLPFRIAFPNRKGGNQWSEIEAEKKKLGGGHYIQMGDGHFSVTGGWPSVFAHHSGGNFLGVGPTQRVVTMRVMDFYLHHEGLIRENWVPLDVIQLLLQMDIDVFDRLQPLFRRGAI